jgi:hypothetical protein
VLLESTQHTGVQGSETNHEQELDHIEGNSARHRITPTDRFFRLSDMPG